MATSFTNMTPAEAPAFGVFGQIVDVSKFALVDVTTDGDRQSADYIYAEGDPALPLKLHVRINSDPKFNGGVGVKRVSVRLSGWLKAHDDVSELDNYFPVEAVMAWNIPGTSMRDVTGLSRMIGTLASLWAVYDVNTYVASSARVAKTDFGIPSIL
jgi:hypothetical protein